MADLIEISILSSRLGWSLIILGVAAFVQATVGFAAALFGLPLLLWAGNSLLEAQLMIITAMLPQNFLSVYKLRSSIHYREIIAPAAIRIAGMPIGVLGLVYVLTWSAASINQLVGAIILVAVSLQALVGIEWKSARHPFWMVTTFGGSGILQGLAGMSGPPMVLWVHGQRYSVDRARAFLFAMYLTNFPPQVLLLWWKFGSGVFQVIAAALLSLPLVLATTLLGLRLGSWLGERWLRPLAYAVLLWLALVSLLDPWLHSAIYPKLHSFFYG